MVVFELLGCFLDFNQKKNSWVGDGNHGHAIARYYRVVFAYESGRVKKDRRQRRRREGMGNVNRERLVLKLKYKKIK